MSMDELIEKQKFLTRESDPIIFAVLGDLHLTDACRENYRTALWAVEEINNLIHPDFGVFIGDNTQEATPEQFALFHALRARLTMPNDVLVGDHDVHHDPQAKGFHRYVGETYGARKYPGVRFLRLNTQEAKPLGLSARQIAWFRDQVDEALSSGEQIIIFQHNYPFQIWENFDGPGIEKWRWIVQTRRIAALVCGHTHYFQIANDGRNVSVAVRSIGDAEGGAPGYLVGYLHGDDLAFVYRTVEDTGPCVLITHPRDALLATGPDHIVCGADHVRVWARSELSIASARWRVNAGEWRFLEAAGNDQWFSDLFASEFSKGRHILEVEVRDEAGQTGRRRQEFMVDETGRYNPIPTVNPMVTQTKFC